MSVPSRTPNYGSRATRKGRNAPGVGAAPIIRKPVEKTYGAKAAYSETAYERRRRERREAADPDGTTTEVERQENT